MERIKWKRQSYKRYRGIVEKCLLDRRYFLRLIRKRYTENELIHLVESIYVAYRPRSQDKLTGFYFDRFYHLLDPSKRVIINAFLSAIERVPLLINMTQYDVKKIVSWRLSLGR